MATIRLHSDRNKIRKDGKVKVYLDLVHLRKRKFIPLDVYVYAEHFDFDACKCLKSHPSSPKYNVLLLQQLAKAEEALLVNSSKRLSIDQLALIVSQAIVSGPRPDLVRPFVEGLMSDMKKTGRNGNARTYNTALVQLEKYHDGEPRWSDLTYQYFTDFKTSKTIDGVKPNSISNYLRTYRAWINEAIKRGVFPRDSYPFQKGLIPNRQRTAKRNLDIDLIRQLIDIRHKLNGVSRQVVNTLLLQFYLQGADFIDVVRLRKSDIKDGYIHFTRYKNRSKCDGQLILVKLLPEIEEIIAESTNDFLVPVVSLENLESNYTRYETRLRNFRRSLYSIIEEYSLGPITTKAIRHTWATIAASLGIREEVRELAMGHTTYDMQSIYTNLAQEEVDLANKRVIESIKKAPPTD